MFRLASNELANKTQLYKTAGFDMIFAKNYEFVYVKDFAPWSPVNGTWKGVLGHVYDDTA